MGCRSRTGTFASSSTRNHRRTAPMACGRKRPGRPTACSMRSAVQDRTIIGLDIQPDSRCVVRSGVQPPPAAALDCWRRNGRTIDPCGVSPAVPANSRHDSPADRRSRPTPPRARPFPCERAAPCNRPKEVLRAGSRSMLYGHAALSPARTRGAHTAIRSGTSGPPRYQSVESDCQRVISWSICILYAIPAFPSRSHRRTYFADPDRGRSKSFWPGKADLTMPVFLLLRESVLRERRAQPGCGAVPAGGRTPGE